MQTTASELDTIRAAQSGDDVAFAVVARQFESRVLSAAYRRLRDHHVAEDAAQESLLQAYVRLDQLRSPAAFGPWLNSIVTSKARQLRPVSPPTDDDPDAFCDEQMPPVDQLLERELIRRGIRASLLRLPEHQRGVVTCE